MNTRQKGQPVNPRPWENRRAILNKTPPPAPVTSAPKKAVKPPSAPPVVTKAAAVKAKAKAAPVPRKTKKVPRIQEPSSLPVGSASEAQAATSPINPNDEGSALDLPARSTFDAQSPTRIPQRRALHPPARLPLDSAVGSATHPVLKSVPVVPRSSVIPAPPRPVVGEAPEPSPLRKPPPAIARTISPRRNETNESQSHSASRDQSPEVPPPGALPADSSAAETGAVGGAVPGVAADKPTGVSPSRVRTYGRQHGDRSPRRYRGDPPPPTRRNGTSPRMPARRSLSPLRSPSVRRRSRTSSPSPLNEDPESDLEEPSAPFPQLRGGRISKKKIAELTAAKEEFMKVVRALAKELGMKVSTLLKYCRFANTMSMPKRPTAWNVFQSQASANAHLDNKGENADANADVGIDAEPNEDSELSALPLSTLQSYEALQAKHGGKESEEWAAYSKNLTQNYQAKKIASEQSMVAVGSYEARIMSATKRAWDPQMQWLANMGIHCAYFMITSNPSTSTAHRENCISIGTPELIEWFDNKFNANTSLNITSDIYHYLLAGSYPEVVIADRIQAFLDKRHKELKNRDETRKACVKTMKMLFAPYYTAERIEWAVMGSVLRRYQMRLDNCPLASEFPMFGSCTGEGYDTGHFKVLYKALGAENPVEAYAAEDQSDLIQVNGWRSEERASKGKDLGRVVLITDVNGEVLMRVKDTYPPSKEPLQRALPSSQGVGSKRKRAVDQGATLASRSNIPSTSVHGSGRSTVPSALTSSSPLPSSSPLASLESPTRSASGLASESYTEDDFAGAKAWLRDQRNAPQRALHPHQMMFPLDSLFDEEQFNDRGGFSSFNGDAGSDGEGLPVGLSFSLG